MRALWRRWRTLRRAVRRAQLGSQRGLALGYLHRWDRPMEPVELEVLTGLSRRLLRSTMRSLIADRLVEAHYEHDRLLCWELTDEGKKVASW